MVNRRRRREREIKPNDPVSLKGDTCTTGLLNSFQIRMLRSIYVLKFGVPGPPVYTVFLNDANYIREIQKLSLDHD